MRLANSRPRWMETAVVTNPAIALRRDEDAFIRWRRDRLLRAMARDAAHATLHPARSPDVK